METTRRIAWVLTLAWLLISPRAADADPYQDWVAFREDFAKLAGGPTGMYAIQDMQQLKAGERASLLPAKRVRDIRWSRELKGNALVTAEFQDGHLTVKGKGIPDTDLLQAKDRQLQMPNGLILRASLVHDTEVKAWLYNPQLTKQRRFKGLAYFPYDPKGVVTGIFLRHSAPTAITYLDSRDQESTMYVMGTLQVTIDGTPHELKTLSYKKDWNEIDGVLVLLKDRTSGKTTYGGGRVVEVQFPKGQPPESMTVNLNMAYSFLCAHSNFYNCPLVLTNNVDADLNYGEKYPPL